MALNKSNVTGFLDSQAEYAILFNNLYIKYINIDDLI